MKITQHTEEGFIRSYLIALQPELGLVPRELEIAVMFVCRYRLLDKTYKKLTTTKAREEFNLLERLRSKQAVRNMTQKLNMEFATFRNYLTGLKHKGFFVTGGDINPRYRPLEDTVTLNISYEARH